MKIFRFGPVGRIRIKGENSAPSEWKRSIWDKIKNNDLFTPINIHDENNIREIKIFFNKKVFVVGINLFLLSFSYSFIKDFYIIIQSRNKILKINEVDFSKDLPPKLLNSVARAANRSVSWSRRCPIPRRCDGESAKRAIAAIDGVSSPTSWRSISIP